MLCYVNLNFKEEKNKGKYSLNIVNSHYIINKYMCVIKKKDQKEMK